MGTYVRATSSLLFHCISLGLETWRMLGILSMVDGMPRPRMPGLDEFPAALLGIGVLGFSWPVDR